MLKRFIWCTIWLLCVVLVGASLDAAPDPPALDPHVRMVKVPGPNEWSQGPWSQLESANSSSLIAPEITIFVADTDPSCPTAVVTETGQAADTSPPRAVRTF